MVPSPLEYSGQLSSPYEEGNSKPGEIAKNGNKDNQIYATAFV